MCKWYRFAWTVELAGTVLREERHELRKLVIVLDIVVHIGACASAGFPLNSDHDQHCADPLHCLSRHVVVHVSVLVHVAGYSPVCGGLSLRDQFRDPQVHKSGQPQGAVHGNQHAGESVCVA